jgi:hypothetical protein
LSLDKMAEMDFDRARRKAFWRRVLAWLKGESNELLTFDEVREKLPIKGQYYAGLKQVSTSQIIGSFGRYRDFDRAFLPIQSRTRGRWQSIDKAHYEDVILPPVELYKMGDIYFVKDGNHRVSVARERGQDYVDAFVIEIVVPFSISPDAEIEDISLKKERAIYLEQTELDKFRPENEIQTNRAGQYAQLLEHISVHRWYLGEQEKQDVSYSDAVISWYDTVYLPLVDVLREHGILDIFTDLTETDLYLWVIKYQYYLRQIIKDEAVDELLNTEDVEENVKLEAARQVIEDHPMNQLGKLISVLRKADWLDDVIVNQERAAFYKRTRLNELIPGVQIVASIPGQYEILLDHIDAHRWYLGEHQGVEVPYEEALKSWYHNVYLPLVVMIRDQEILVDFPDRTETDLYLWIISHQWYLRETLGADVPAEQVAEQLADTYSAKETKKSRGSSKKFNNPD